MLPSDASDASSGDNDWFASEWHQLSNQQGHSVVALEDQ